MDVSCLLSERDCQMDLWFQGHAQVPLEGVLGEVDKSGVLQEMGEGCRNVKIWMFVP